MKKVKAIVKIQIPAGKATPAPPVGQILAPHGLNLSEFCLKFNDATKNSQGFIIPVEVTIFEDRSFTFILKQPPAAELLKKAAGIEKGSGTPNKTKAGKITRAQLKEIAERKMPDLNTDSIDQATKIIEGTAKSLGITVE
jgi:large subunit ribosomal protein L11